MKKLFLFAVAAFTMLATSCSKDADVVAPVEKGTVTFAVATPQLATRAVIGDGETATTLHYAVYDENWNHLSALYGTKNFVSETTVNFELIDGKVYNFIFWAQNAAAPYSFDPDTKSMKVNYAGIKSNVEAHDAFYATVEALKIKSGIQQEVKLYRPFAQLNIATSDWVKFTASEETFSNTEVKVYAYDTLDLVSGDVANGAERTFTMNTMVTEEFAYDGTNYKWLSMNYILVDDKELVQVTFNANNTDVAEKTWNNVPVERNYRTNILGDILTSDTQFNVIVVEDFMEPDNVVDADGENLQQVAEGVLYDSKTKTFMLQNDNGLKWFATAVDGITRTSTVDTANGTFKGYTVELVEDIDLQSAEWTPIGNSSKKFQGTFDGNNYTIKNLVITGNDSNVGLFGFTTDGAIKNLVIENAKVSGYLNVGVVAGTPYTSKYENITIKGLVEVNGMAYVGAVGGKNAYADWTNITIDVEEGSYVRGNSIEGTVAYRTYVGGAIGFMGEGGHKFTNVTSNIDVYGTTCDVGGIAGIAHYGNSFINCSSTGNVSITDADDESAAEQIGGIAGVWHNQNGQKVTFKGCSFGGELSVNVDGVDLSDNTIVGAPYSATGTGELIIE